MLWKKLFVINAVTARRHATEIGLPTITGAMNRLDKRRDKIAANRPHFSCNASENGKKIPRAKQAT